MARAKKLNFEEFMGRFGWEAYDRGTRVMEPPLPASLIPELRVITEAARQGCPSAFSFFLQQWLKRHGIDPPEGVFQPIGRRRQGRPEAPDAFEIHLLWITIGKPSVTSTKLAKAYHGDAYTNADAATRKEMIDRLRQAVTRYEQRISHERGWRRPRCLTPPD